MKIHLLTESPTWTTGVFQTEIPSTRKVAEREGREKRERKQKKKKTSIKEEKERCF